MSLMRLYKDCPLIINTNDLIWSKPDMGKDAVYRQPGSPVLLYLTDDPEPVEYKQMEICPASQYIPARDQDSATLPHVEINYGLIPNVQIHLITPLQYVDPGG